VRKVLVRVKILSGSGQSQTNCGGVGGHHLLEGTVTTVLCSPRRVVAVLWCCVLPEGFALEALFDRCSASHVLIVYIVQFKEHM
jgi:hypothetical protein